MHEVWLNYWLKKFSVYLTITNLKTREQFTYLFYYLCMLKLINYLSKDFNILFSILTTTLFC